MRFLIAILALCAALSSHAAVIDFAGPHGPLSGPTAEGIYTYSVYTGGIFRQAICCGNPLPHLEGDTGQNNDGVLSIIRNDVSGGTFTFASADVAVFSFDGVNVLVQAFFQGSLVAADTLVTLPGDDNWVTASAVNLAGLTLDELRITLPIGPQGQFAELDNVTLDPIGVAATPEPGSLLTAAAALALITVRAHLQLTKRNN